MLDEEFIRNHDVSGASFTSLVVQDVFDGSRSLFVAYVGDIEANIVIDSPLDTTSFIQSKISKHTPDEPNEKSRLESLGVSEKITKKWGFFPRIYGLPVSRSIGNKLEKELPDKAIIADPTILNFDITKKNAAVMIASGVAAIRIDQFSSYLKKIVDNNFAHFFMEISRNNTYQEDKAKSFSQGDKKLSAIAEMMRHIILGSVIYKDFSITLVTIPAGIQNS